MKLLDVPFYVNPDRQSCVPTCFRMALEYLNPEKKFSQEEINKMLEKKPGKWGKAGLGLIKLKKQGFDVREIIDWDAERFIEKGVDYLYEKYGKKITEESYIPNYDFDVAIKYEKELVELGIIENKKLSFREVEDYFREGYLLLIIVNSNTLYGGEKYAGHVVIITGINDKHVWINECSQRCPEKNKRIDKELFIKAWDQKGTDNEIILIKKPQP